MMIAFHILLQTSLFKFVSGCADLLPPLLFAPYMKMLCSLASHPQAARHAFNLLKQNVVGNSVNVSWDHFFQSLNRYLVCSVFMHYFQEIFPEVIHSQKCHMNMGLILIGYGAVDISCYDFSAHAWADKGMFKWKSLCGCLESITYEHRVSRWQGLSMLPTCISDPDVLHKAMHSIVICVRMDIQTRLSFWTNVELNCTTL